MKRYRIVARYKSMDDPYYIVQQKKWYGWGLPNGRCGFYLQDGLDDYEEFNSLEKAENALEKYVKANYNYSRKDEVVKEYEK